MEKINNDNPTRIIVLLTFTALLWGGNAVAAKKVLSEISPFVVTMLRFAVFSCLLLLLSGYREGRHCLPALRQLPTLFLMGLFGTVVNNGVQFTGLMYSTAINCVVITAFGPAITGVLAAVMLNERLNGRQWLGVAISSVGVVVIASLGSAPSRSPNLRFASTASGRRQAQNSSAQAWWNCGPLRLSGSSAEKA